MIEEKHSACYVSNVIKTDGKTETPQRATHDAVQYSSKRVQERVAALERR